MNLSIPGIPFEMVVTLTRKPPASTRRLSLSGLLVWVMILTILTWIGIRVFDRYAYTTNIKTYYVGDLLPRGPNQVRTELSRFAELLKSSAPHDLWSSRNRGVTPFPLSVSLIVSDSKLGHQQVEDWLRNRRKEQYDVPVPIDDDFGSR